MVLTPWPLGSQPAASSSRRSAASRLVVDWSLSVMPDAHSLADPPPLPPARSGDGAATLPADRQSGGLSPPAGVRRPPRPSSCSSARDRARCGGPSCCPPLWPALALHLTHPNLR